METGLFPGYVGERCNLRMATPVILSHKVWYRIRTHVIAAQTRLITVWDAFAGVGIDAIIASKILKTTVFATEVHGRTYELLEQNIRRQKANVIACRADALQNAFRTDLVYLDPPWGDEFYPTAEFDFFLKFRPLLEFMQQWARFIVIKTPILLGPTEPPWTPVYTYRSEKYRITIWLFDMSPLYHARAIGPSDTVCEYDSANKNGQGDPYVG